MVLEKHLVQEEALCVKRRVDAAESLAANISLIDSLLSFVYNRKFQMMEIANEIRRSGCVPPICDSLFSV